MSAAPVFEDDEVLLALEGVPLPWPGRVVEAACAGPLCTEGPLELTIWAPGGAWQRAFRLLAMFRSAPAERCLVLTDALPPLHLVPRDGRVAVVVGRTQTAVHRGRADFSCAELRSDRIFRLLLRGRARRRPELQVLLRLHVLAATQQGRSVLDRWSDLVPVLFAAGLEGMMPEELRTDLEELTEAARSCEQAITGGFHALDPLVRGPAEWEAGARTYLALAASRSKDALTAVDRWLAAWPRWDLAPPDRQEELRRSAARMLHHLADDPWTSGDALAGLARGEPR